MNKLYLTFEERNFFAEVLYNGVVFNELDPVALRVKFPFLLQLERSKVLEMTPVSLFGDDVTTKVSLLNLDLGMAYKMFATAMSRLESRCLAAWYDRTQLLTALSSIGISDPIGVADMLVVMDLVMPCSSDRFNFLQLKKAW